MLAERLCGVEQFSPQGLAEFVHDGTVYRLDHCLGRVLVAGDLCRDLGLLPLEVVQLLFEELIDLDAVRDGPISIL
ncbi:MAG TPA: hypothetical protein VIH45_04340 [Desulfuromonadaceae bacterium]